MQRTTPYAITGLPTGHGHNMIGSQMTLCTPLQSGTMPLTVQADECVPGGSKTPTGPWRSASRSSRGSAAPSRACCVGVCQVSVLTNTRLLQCHAVRLLFLAYSLPVSDGVRRPARGRVSGRDVWNNVSKPSACFGVSQVEKASVSFSAPLSVWPTLFISGTAVLGCEWFGPIDTSQILFYWPVSGYELGFGLLAC
jgi:hypothetical protein